MEIANSFKALAPLWRWVIIGLLAATLILLALTVVLLCIRRRGAKRAKDAKSDAPRRGLRIANVHNVGARENQQDSFCVSNIADKELSDARGVLLLVADGMGGLSDGAAASAMVQSSFLKGFSLDHQLPDDPFVALALLLNRANDRVLNYRAESGSDCGSTAVAAIVRAGWLYFASVGDSRICLVRGGGLIPLNREQTYGVEVDDKAARGVLSWAEACAEKQRRALTSYIGAHDMCIDRGVQPVRLLSGDRVVLMSDGVFGTLDEIRLASLLSGDVYEAASRVESAVLAANKPAQDNFTAIILEDD